MEWHRFTLQELRKHLQVENIRYQTLEVFKKKELQKTVVTHFDLKLKESQTEQYSFFFLTAVFHNSPIQPGSPCLHHELRKPCFFSSKHAYLGLFPIINTFWT